MLHTTLRQYCCIAVAAAEVEVPGGGGGGDCVVLATSTKARVSEVAK